MPKTVVVLKPFVFTFPPKSRREKLATELKVVPNRDPVTKDWVPTERELPDEVAEHEWVSQQFADGAIERPEKTQARMEAAAEKHKEEAAAAQKIIEQAQAALARMTKTAEATQVREEDLTRELETPVSQLRAQQGMDLDAPPKGKGKKE